jgi:peptidoglycan/xylan/chitin deacetylase (PgdA/CDA1 family)
MTPERSRPSLEPLAGSFGYALTIDVEEWYHTCLVPDFVHPERRPPLPEELDRLLPEILELLARAARRATFFFLGEVASRLPERVREVAAAGHEVACHGFHHLRVGELSPAELRDDVRRSKALLEDLIGAAVIGYRAPEWSMRHVANERLPLLVEAGFSYDSSLAPFLGAGRIANPRRPVRMTWPGGVELAEFPPLTFGGPLRLPAGSWPGRLAGPGRVVAAAAAEHRRGGLPVGVVHPWELSGRPTPGRLTGLARFVHETGRLGFRRSFLELLAALPWDSLSRAAGPAAGIVAPPPARRSTLPADHPSDREQERQSDRRRAIALDA